MFTTLWSRRANRKSRADRVHATRCLRLGMELLEDRSLLSAYTPGPLALISHPDPLVNAPPGVLGTDVAAEPYVAVNPTNPNNIAAIWMDQYPNANAVSVTLDGGATWQNVVIPGFTQVTGGTSRSAFDPWLSFDPNGNLYSSGGAGLPKGNALFLVNKSTDGGLSWSSPIRVNTPGNDGNGWGPYGDDKPSITADPINPNYVYMTWARFNEATSFKGQSAETMFARSMDGGLTWQTEQSIHTTPQSDFVWGHQIVVLPDGTLIDAYTEGKFTNNHQGELTLQRSADHGLTWSNPISALVQRPLVDSQEKPPNAIVTDPDTGQPVEAHPMFPSIAVDRQSGNLYAAWIDARFSNFQYNSVAYSMSTDGGFTWSTPIQVNQTPSTVPAIDRQAWNPTVAVAADGTVGVSYYDFRNNTAAAGALTDYWLAYGPATNPSAWGEVRLTENSFDLELVPTRFGGDSWLGDYEGLAAAGNDFVAVWGMPDGSATDQESIFFRRALSNAPALAAATTSTSLAPSSLALAATVMSSQSGGGHLLVGSFDNNGVLSYDETTGAFESQFDPHNFADLKTPVGGVFGPDGNLYVSSGVFSSGQRHGVLQYNGTTGAFQREFATQNVTSPRGILFGPDGDLYMANGNSAADDDPASVERFDGKTGAFLDYFVKPNSGGIEHPSYMVFGPDGLNDGKLDLYVANAHDGNILRYDGATRAFKGVFVSGGTGGLDSPQGMVFGADGNLFVASGNWFNGINGPFYTGDFPPGAVLRYQGPTGANPGAFLGTFVAGGSGGLGNPAGLIFGPGGDLYVSSAVVTGRSANVQVVSGTSEVLRYDGATGAFLGVFVTPASGGLKFPTFLTFTETNPSTLEYEATSTLTTFSTASAPDSQTVNSVQTPSLFAVPTVHRHAAPETSAPESMQSLLPIALDHIVAGWGLFVDPTPPGDSEFGTSGNKVEWYRTGPLFVLSPEAGHRLGRGHEADGLIADMLPARTQEVPDDNNAADTLFALCPLFTDGDQATSLLGPAG
jgi:hypothetical protein